MLIQIENYRKIVTFTLIDKIFFLVHQSQTYNIVKFQFKLIKKMFQNKTGNLLAITCFIKTFPEYSDKIITAEKLADGIIFTQILSQVQGFDFTEDELRKDIRKWRNKLSNLKRLLQKIEDFLNKGEKGVSSFDIDLVDIAKKCSPVQISKFFQIFITVLMESSAKEEYIEKIMSLDEQSQRNFVFIVQNSMNKRLCSIEDSKKHRILQNLHTLESQNMSLVEDIEQLVKLNETLQAKISNYQNSLDEMEFRMDKGKKNDHQSESIDVLTHKNEQNLQIIQHLKQKIIQVTRNHELELTEQSMEINNLKEKLKESETMEEMVLFYRDKYEETISHMNKISAWDKEKARYKGILEEKEFTIAKLQQKIQELTKKIIEFEEKELDMRIEIERRDTRLKQIEKGMKSRINLNVSLENTKNNVLADSNQRPHSFTHESENKQAQIEQKYYQLKKNYQTLDKKSKQLQRQNGKLAKRAENVKILELEKKKLEAIILELDQKNAEELDIMVAALHETHKQYGNLFRVFVKK